MKTKLCPDFAHPCIEEACMAYVPNSIYFIDTPYIIAQLFPELDIDLKLIQYPFFLDIKTGFCKKYSNKTDDNNEELLMKLDEIIMETNLNE